jgi:hypothetical protein
MFTPDDIRTRVRQQPFIPVRIVTSAGQMFDVYHPDMIMVGRRLLVVGMLSSENPEHFEKVTQLAIMHVTALENLPSPTTGSDGNGQP